MPPDNQSKVPIWPSIRRLIRLSGRNQVLLYSAMLFVVLSALLNIAWLFTLARFIDAATANDQANFLRYLWITLALIAANLPLAFLRSRTSGIFSERTMLQLRETITARLTVLPMRYMEEHHTGDLLAVVNADLTKLKNLTASALLGVVQQSFSAVAALIALFVLSWQLALASTLAIPLLFMIMSRLSQPVARRAEQLQQAIGETVSLAQDGLGGLMVTKTFNLAGVMEDRFRQANQKARSKGLVLSRLQAGTDGIGGVFGVLPFLITFGLGGYLAINGYLTFGSLMAFISLLNYVANPLNSLPGLIASISEAAGAAQRTFQILDQAPERSDGKAYPQNAAGPVARLEGVHFAYGEDPVLRGVSLAVQRGQTVAVVGPSGGGKSTLLKLLLGFYPLENGRLFLFEQDINDWSLAEARQQMAFVAQDTYLFPVSIAENIACGRIGASQEQIERAARMANIHDYIVSLPEGYQTPVGERGARLSGGQRQRLSLARAILKDAPILLLDEPTSALDTESEALVQEALERFMSGRTTIVIAHRLSTIRNADQVVVLQDGQIVEQGTHDQLMERAGRYKELYLRQFDLDNPAEGGGQHGQ